MTTIRAASLCLVLATASAPVAAQAQGPGSGASFSSRVEALEAAVSALQQALAVEASDRAAGDAGLNSRLSKLEGDITSADLVGTYRVTALQNELSATGLPFRITSSVFVGTVTLAGDGTTAFNGTETGHSWTMMTRSPADAQRQGTFGTWSYSGGVVTATEGLFPLAVAVGGRMLIGGGANHDDGTNVIFIFTRLE